MTGAESCIAEDLRPVAALRGPKVPIDAGGLISFLAAGAVLFASLVVGSSVSLLFAGSNALLGAILVGFLSLGLWALGGFLTAFALAFAVSVALGRNRRDRT